ncbi:unnamed protein product, partial [Polarella glacialis]
MPRFAGSSMFHFALIAGLASAIFQACQADQQQQHEERGALHKGVVGEAAERYEGECHSGLLQKGAQKVLPLQHIPPQSAVSLATSNNNSSNDNNNNNSSNNNNIDASETELPSGAARTLLQRRPDVLWGLMSASWLKRVADAARDQAELWQRLGRLEEPASSSQSSGTLLVQKQLPTVSDYQALEGLVLRNASSEALQEELSGLEQLLILIAGQEWGNPLPDDPSIRAHYQQKIRARSWAFSIAIALFCYFLACQDQVVVSSDGEEEEESRLQKETEENESFTSNLRKITHEELKSHAQLGDLWLAIGGVVCDLSEFTAVHPGGYELLVQYAGTEVGHSQFSLSVVREKAIGVLASPEEAKSLKPGEADTKQLVPEGGSKSWVGRIFTKEDPYHLHKTMGCLIVIQFLFRSGMVMSGTRFDGLDAGGFGKDYFSLACVWLCAALQFSSFKFHVPRNRILGAPMIWQEWRAHNAIFVLRHVIGFTIRWYAWRIGSHGGPQESWLLLGMFGTLLWQLWSVDVVTAQLREDQNESLTATWPFWKGCPNWVERFLKFYYTVAQFMASLMMTFMDRSLYGAYLVIFPFQWASFLMTLVRKGAITTRAYHVLYLWSLMQVMVLILINLDATGWIATWFLWVVMYVVRVMGVNKYSLWIGVFLPSFVVYWADSPWLLVNSSYIGLFPFVCWGVSAILQWSFARGGLEKRSRRYLESRTKPLTLVQREKVSESLYWLRFQIPYGYSSGLAPGQHVT